MNHELAKTLTTALVQFIDRERPEGSMCCSNAECEAIEQAFIADNFFYVETLVQRRLSRLTEFENAFIRLLSMSQGEPPKGIEDFAKEHSKELLALAKKELARLNEVITLDKLQPYDKGFQDGKAEAMADLERTFECNSDKLPKWLKEELGKKHLEGYIKGRNDALHGMSDFMESHFNMQSGTSTAKAEG